VELPHQFSHRRSSRVDLVYIAIIVAFTALCLAYIAWCDHIIGPDDADMVAAGSLPAANQEPVNQ